MHGNLDCIVCVETLMCMLQYVCTAFHMNRSWGYSSADACRITEMRCTALVHIVHVAMKHKSLRRASFYVSGQTCQGPHRDVSASDPVSKQSMFASLSCVPMHTLKEMERGLEHCFHLKRNVILFHQICDAFESSGAEPNTNQTDME